MSDEFDTSPVILVWEGGDRICEQAGCIHTPAPTPYKLTHDSGERTMHLSGPTPRIATWEVCLRNCAFGEVSEVEEKVGPEWAARQLS